MTRLFATASVAGLILALTAGAASAIPVINFDGVTSLANVDGFYNGGTDSMGASGPNYGVQFVNFTATTGFGESSPPNLAYVNSPTGAVDVAAGFQSSVSFTQGLFTPGTIAVFSGLDGTGALLATAALPASNPGAFAPFSLSFAGTADSVIFTDGAGGGSFGIDDLQLGSTVPEPATWSLMILGFGGLGALSRSRRDRAIA